MQGITALGCRQSNYNPFIFLCFFFFQDIDECQVNIHNCHEDGVCINTDGSYRCECKVGFIGSGEICSGIELCQLKSKFVFTTHADST